MLPFQGPFPKPSLRAHPSDLVPLKQSVTLRCQGPPVVDLYRLEKLTSKEYENQNFLFIPTMKTSNAGRYRCSYQNGSHWSPASDQLELIATGNWTGRDGVLLVFWLRAAWPSVLPLARVKEGHSGARW